MSFLPIFTGFAINGNYEYFGKIQHAVTFYIGDYNWKNGYILWLFGVILSGIWAYFIFLYYPFTSLLLTVLRFCIGHNKKLTKQCIKIIMMPINIGAFVIMFLMSMGYVTIFIGLFILYNPNTYKGPNHNNNHSILALYGLMNIFIVIPILACIMQILPKRDKIHRIYNAKSFESMGTHDKSNKIEYMQVSNHQHIEEIELEEKELETMPIINGDNYKGQHSEH
eukprot:383878_1